VTAIKFQNNPSKKPSYTVSVVNMEDNDHGKAYSLQGLPQAAILPGGTEEGVKCTKCSKWRLVYGVETDLSEDALSSISCKKMDRMCSQRCDWCFHVSLNEDEKECDCTTLGDVPLSKSVENEPIVDNEPIVNNDPIVNNEPMVNNEPIVVVVVDNEPIVNNEPIVSQPVVPVVETTRSTRSRAGKARNVGSDPSEKINTKKTRKR